MNYKNNPHYKMSAKQESEYDTQRKSEKLVELFKQIKELGFRSLSLSAHDIPVLELGEEWLVVRKFTSEGNMYFTADFVGTDKEVSAFGITLFGGIPPDNRSTDKEAKAVLERAYEQGCKDTKEKLGKAKK